MNSLAVLFVLLAGAVGFLIGWLFSRAHSAGVSQRASLLEQELLAQRSQLERAKAEADLHRTEAARLLGTLESERKSTQEKLAVLENAKLQLCNAFEALSAQALKSNNESFIALATATLQKFQSEAKGDLEQRQKAVETLVSPIRESLGKVDQQIQQLEKARSEAYGSLSMQVTSLLSSQQQLQAETSNLVQALRAPHVRGRWGEMQLRRVVEMAGMLNYCDFEEQVSISTSDGRLRPDLIVRLPGGKNVVVDAKSPLQAYLSAIEAPDDMTRRARMADHARQIRDHMTKLSQKGYWDQFHPTPEFVIMFLPGEVFFSAALEHDPSLIEVGVAQKVLVASPTTLIALLRAVAYGWTQERLAESAEQISELGSVLYERLRTVASYVSDVGRKLDGAVDAYNKAVGSLESRVLVAARKFPELSVPVKDEIPELEPIEKVTRELQSSEWVHNPDQKPLPLEEAAKV